jgi:hypothetical protein
MNSRVNPEYHGLRAKMVARGTSLAAWARKRRYPLMTVYGAARGERDGKRAKQIRRELESFLHE